MAERIVKQIGIGCAVTLCSDDGPITELEVGTAEASSG